MSCPRKFPDGTEHGTKYLDAEGFCKAPVHDPSFPKIKYCWYSTANLKRGNKEYNGECTRCFERPATKGSVCDTCRKERQHEYYIRHRYGFTPPPVTKSKFTIEHFHKIREINLLNLSEIVKRTPYNKITVLGLLCREITLTQNQNNMLKAVGQEIKTACQEILTLLEDV